MNIMCSYPFPLAVLDSKSKSQFSSTCFRAQRNGPESELVDDFLTRIPLRVPKGCRATVFREPRIESGFPDLVIVVWREATTKDWSSYRRFVETYDLRILQFIHNAHQVTNDEIAAQFGRKGCASIQRLKTAKLIYAKKQGWMPYSLQRTFAATKIIAVEAKIGKWSHVLAQAKLNTWFASKSYVLTGTPPSHVQLREAEDAGIGICTLEKSVVTEKESEVGSLPLSYVSWLFNEWAWQSTLSKGEM